MRVLVTGASGWTAVAIIQALHRAKHDIVGFDLNKVRYRDDARPLLTQVISGDMANFAQVQAALQATAPHAVIHLAVAVGPDDYQAPDVPFDVNVKGTYNLFEAARRNSVGKIVLISSAAVHLPHEGAPVCNALTDWRSSPKGDHLYDLTKRLQEEIAKDFCETFGMQVVVLRAGHIVDGKKSVDAKGRDLASLDYCRGGWVCRYDLAQACLKALEVPSTGYAAFHVIGAEQARQHFDVERIERDLASRPLKWNPNSLLNTVNKWPICPRRRMAITILTSRFP